VLAHPDLIKLTGRRPAVPDEWYDRMAEAAASSGMAAELSSAGLRKPAGEPYPAPPLLARFRKAGVPATTASDAHHVGDVASAGPALRALLADAGYESLVAFRRRERSVVAL
jgi:histidinol-phosphatase (PHP family)